MSARKPWQRSKVPSICSTPTQRIMTARRWTVRTNNERIVPIKKPSFEVAEILREYIGPYQDAFPLFPEHYKIVHNLLSCRTSELGGHMEKCDHCGTERISYNS